MGLIDLPSSREFIESVDWVIPSDKRDFTRSTPDYTMTFPRELQFAEDGDPFIRQVQIAMKNNPISFPYAGPIDGKKSGKWYDHLRNVLIQLGWKLAEKFGKKVSIIRGGEISPEGFAEAMALLKEKPKEDKDEEDKDEDATQNNQKEVIKSFQSFFSKFNPVIGKLYSGSIDGKINDELISAAKATESAIASAIKNNNVYGALFNSKNKTFNTTVIDLKQALELIEKHNKKLSFLDTKGRKLAFYAILNR